MAVRVSSREADELAGAYESMVCEPYAEDDSGLTVSGSRRLGAKTRRESAAFGLGQATGYARGMCDALRILGVNYEQIPKDPGAVTACYEESALWVRAG